MLKYQRLSNNWQPDFTDQELLTVYLFGQLQGHFKQKRIHEYILQHFADWFADLPTYQSFNYRLNNLAETLPVIVFELLRKLGESYQDYFEEDCVIDSMPIMLAVRGRSLQAKVAGEIANQSYCANKAIYYHGVKMHLLARKRGGQLPQPEMLKITPAADHDLRVLQEFEGKILGNAFADKAYTDGYTERGFKEKGVIICTPDKKRKNQEVYEVGGSRL